MIFHKSDRVVKAEKQIKSLIKGGLELIRWTLDFRCNGYKNLFWIPLYVDIKEPSWPNCRRVTTVILSFKLCLLEQVPLNLCYEDSKPGPFRRTSKRALI